VGDREIENAVSVRTVDDVKCAVNEKYLVERGAASTVLDAASNKGVMFPKDSI
jgi:hypothetical protein